MYMTCREGYITCHQRQTLQWCKLGN